MTGYEKLQVASKQLDRASAQFDGAATRAPLGGNRQAVVYPWIDGRATKVHIAADCEHKIDITLGQARRLYAYLKRFFG